MKSSTIDSMWNVTNGTFNVTGDFSNGIRPLPKIAEVNGSKIITLKFKCLMFFWKNFQTFHFLSLAWQIYAKIIVSRLKPPLEAEICERALHLCSNHIIRLMTRQKFVMHFSASLKGVCKKTVFWNLVLHTKGF